MRIGFGINSEGKGIGLTPDTSLTCWARNQKRFKTASKEEAK